MQNRNEQRCNMVEFRQYQLGKQVNLFDVQNIQTLHDYHIEQNHNSNQKIIQSQNNHIHQKQLNNIIKRKSTWQRRRDAKRQIDLLLMRRMDEYFIRDQSHQYGLSVGQIIQKASLQDFECKQRSSNGKAQGTELTMYSVDLGRRVCKALKDLFGYEGRPTVKSINGIRVSFYPCLKLVYEAKQCKQSLQ